MDPRARTRSLASTTRSAQPNATSTCVRTSAGMRAIRPAAKSRSGWLELGEPRARRHRRPADPYRQRLVERTPAQLTRRQAKQNLRRFLRLSLRPRTPELRKRGRAVEIAGEAEQPFRRRERVIAAPLQREIGDEVVFQFTVRELLQHAFGARVVPILRERIEHGRIGGLRVFGAVARALRRVAGGEHGVFLREPAEHALPGGFVIRCTGDGPLPGGCGFRRDPIVQRLRPQVGRWQRRKIFARRMGGSKRAESNRSSAPRRLRRWHRMRATPHQQRTDDGDATHTKQEGRAWKLRHVLDRANNAHAQNRTKGVDDRLGQSRGEPNTSFFGATPSQTEIRHLPTNRDAT